MKRAHNSDARTTKQMKTMFKLSASVPRGFLKSYRYRPERPATDIPTFFTTIFAQLVQLRTDGLEKHQYKMTLVLNVQLEKEGPSGATATPGPFFCSKPVCILHEFDILEAIKDEHERI